MPGSTAWQAATADSRFTASIAWKSAHVVFRERLGDRCAGVVHQDVARTERGDRSGKRCVIGNVGDSVTRTEFAGGALQAPRHRGRSSAMAAPSAASRRAMARPIPLAPPVIMAFGMPLAAEPVMPAMAGIRACPRAWTTGEAGLDGKRVGFGRPPCADGMRASFISPPNNPCPRAGPAARSAPCRPDTASATTDRCNPARRRRAVRNADPTDAAGPARTDRRDRRR